MFLYNRGVSNNFAFIADQHFQGLLDVRILKSGLTYYSTSITFRINELITTGISSTFFKDLAADNYSLLKKIIVGKPDELSDIIECIEANVLFGIYPNITKSTPKGEVLTEFGKKIKSVFDYSYFIRKSNRLNKWDAYSLADEVGVDVCAYCNRNFTFTLKSGKRKIVRPEFDHFLPQSRYPYLALSFYNLIPSCHICNSNLKHTTAFSFHEYLHPFISCFDDVMRFSVELNPKLPFDPIKQKASFGLSFFYGDFKSFSLVFKQRPHVLQSEIDKAKRNINVFKLEELYNKHKDLVIEMVQNSIIYDDAYIDALYNKFGGKLFRNREDVLRHITKNYVANSEMSKRSFSKLSRDIHHEFGLKY